MAKRKYVVDVFSCDENENGDYTYQVEAVSEEHAIAIVKDYFYQKVKPDYLGERSKPFGFVVMPHKQLFIREKCGRPNGKSFYVRLVDEVKKYEKRIAKIFLDRKIILEASHFEMEFLKKKKENIDA